MAIKNMPYADASDFPFTANTFETWWSSNYLKVGKGSTALSTAVKATADTIKLGNTNYTIYEITRTSAPTVSFWFFLAYSGTDTTNYYGTYNTGDERDDPENYQGYSINIGSGETAPTFTYGSSSGTYHAIKLSYKGTYCYYYIAFEYVQKTIRSHSWGDITSPIPNEFEPYQPIEFDTIPTVDFITRYTSASSEEYTSGADAVKVAFAYEEKYTEVGSKTLVATYDGNTFSSTLITISDWTSKIFSIEQIDTNYSIYLAQEVDSEFLGSFQVVLNKSNGYATITSVLENELDLNKMSKTIPSSSTFAFDYDVSSFGGTTISYKDSSVIMLDETNMFKNLLLDKTYQLGDMILATFPAKAGSLTYSDGTTISIESLNLTNYEITSSLGSLPQEITIDTPSEFTVKYGMTFENIGYLTYTANCSTTTSKVKSSKLFNTITSFTPDQLVVMGNNAYIELYDESGNVIDTIQKANFNKFISSYDSRYNKYAINVLDEAGGTITLTSTTTFGTEITQEVYFVFYETTPALDVSSVLRSYIMNPETFTDFDYTGIKFYLNYHGTATTVSQVEVAQDKLTFSHIALDYSKKQTYTITVSYTDEYSVVHKGTFEAVAEGLKATSISVSGNVSYYDNDLDKFEVPSGLTFIKHFNDPTYDTDLTDLTTIKYYRDSNFVNELTADTIIKKSDGANIYFKDTATDLGGTIAVNWLLDSVQKVELRDSVVAYYGNKLKRLKSSCVLKLTMASDEVYEISDPNAFEFVNTEVIYSTPSELQVAIQGYGTFSIENFATMITWQNPIAKLTLDTSDFQKTYNNKVDIVFTNSIKVATKYYYGENECDYSQVLDYTSTSSPLYTEFATVGLGDIASYVFGKDVLNLTLVDTEASEVIQISSVNRFSGETISATTSITVFEILDVIGLKLESVKSDYKVNETFLNEDDDTIVSVIYKGTDGTQKTLKAKLNSGLTALNICPLKGTKFTQIVNNKLITISSATNYNVSVQYAINVSANYSQTDETNTHDLVAVYLSNFVCPDNIQRDAYYLIERTCEVDGNVVENTKINSSGERVLNDGVGADDIEVFGYLADINDESTNARVILFKDYVSPIEGSNNITVKFPCYVKGNADLINNSHFGIMFGNNNAKNRLFVSGNPNYKNKDWHSSEVDSSYVSDETMIDGNYGYFEDLSECSYGETDNAVVGYDIVSNDKLLVLKTKSDKETTVYFRQPQLTTAINSSGTAVSGLNDETLYQEEFTLTKGNNSVAGINPKSIVNFNGDTLFISSGKQVVGLDLTGIIGDNQRYANSRSYYIDEDLKNQDITNAFLWTNNKYLFVVLPTKIYLTHFELKSDSQYEWFVIDVANCTSVLDLDEKIYFGNESGELYCFTDTYKDAKKTFIGYGVARVSVNDSTDLLIAKDSLKNLDTSKTQMFRPIPFNDIDTEYIYYSLGIANTIKSSENCDFYIDKTNNDNVFEINGDLEKTTKMLMRISERKRVFLNKALSDDTEIQCDDGSSLKNAYGKTFYLKHYVDFNHPSKHLYQLIDENGDVAPIKELIRARLCLRVDSDMEMCDIDIDNGTFKLKENDEVVDIIQYNNQTLSTAFKGEIIEYSNVEAFYITKPYDMGNLEYFKTIWSFTLTNDSNIPSELEVCYANNKVAYETMKTLAYVSKDVLGFDFDTFNFAKVDFDKNIVPRTYTHKRVLSHVKFLCFGFKNYNDTNSVLSSLTITYTLPYPSYGGD